MVPFALEFVAFAFMLVVILGLALALVFIGVALTWWAITRGYVQIQAAETADDSPTILTLHEARPDDRRVVEK